jgi:hypothetical protein
MGPAAVLEVLARSAASADDSPFWIAAIVGAGALLVVLVLLLGGPRNDRPR